MVKQTNILFLMLLFIVISGCSNRYNEMKNLEIIKSTYEGENSKENGKNLIKFCAEDIIWTEAQGFPYGGTYVEVNEVVEHVFSRLENEWVNYKFTAEDFISNNNKVIAYGTYSGTYRKTNKSFESRVAHIWELKDGKIIRFEQIVDSKPVIDAIHNN